jgi:N-acetylmuramoyl-L-alanine amidase
MKNFFFFFILILVCLSVSSVVTVDFMHGVIKEINAVESEGRVYGSALAVLRIFSGSHFWAIDKRKLVMHINDLDIVFTENSPYFIKGENICNAVYPPLVENGDMFIYMPALAAVLDSILPEKIIWIQKKKALKVKSGKTVIRRATCEQKKNGTLYTLFLPDTVKFDHTFFKPQLNINIFKGKISVSDLVMKKRVGYVKEVDAVQFADNAQISLILADIDQQPEVAFRDNPPRIEVVIRDKVKKRETPKAALPVSQDEKDQMKREKLSQIKTIIIDPGHGGKDPGAANKKQRVREKDVVLAIGLKLKKILKKELSRVEVVMTRTTDEFIPLRERKKIANSRKGDMFISIHANSIPGNANKRASVAGYSVYFLDVAQDNEARAVEALENSVIEKYEKDSEADHEFSDVEFIITDSKLNFFRNESEDFAIMIEKELDKKLKKVNRRKTGVNQANFYVLRGPEMPAVLVESAFISNPREARILANGSFQENVAEAIYRAIKKFKKKYEVEL